MNEILLKFSLLKKGVTDLFQETYSRGQICAVRLYNRHGSGPTMQGLDPLEENFEARWKHCVHQLK